MNYLHIVVLLSLAMTTTKPLNAANIPKFIQTHLMDHPQRIPGKYIVKLNESESLPKILNASANIQKVPVVNGMYLLNEEGLQALLASENAEAVEYIEAAVRFKGLTKLRTSLPMQHLRQIQSHGVNDPGFEKQWGLWDPKSGVFVKSAWTVSIGKVNTVAAIIDSGIKLDHPDLAPNIWTNKGEQGTDLLGMDKSSNGIDDDNNGFIDDVNGWDFSIQDNVPYDENGHGSHVAGVIGAKAGNERGIVGINHNISLIPLKTFDIDGFSDTTINVQAISYAAQHSVDVINASWGGGPCSQAMIDAINAAAAKGTIFVAASGNNGIDIDQEPVYPCDFPIQSLICVGASDRENKRVEFSNYGKLSVDIAAPGENIYSAFLEPAYKELDGTSMAAPFVAGAAALLKSFRPTLLPREVKKAILESGTKLTENSNDFASGNRLNISAALAYVGGKPTTPIDPPPPPPPVTNLPLIQGVKVTPAGDQALMIEFTNPQVSSIEYFLAAISPNPIVNESQWENAVQSKFEPSDSSTNVRHFFTGLIPNSRGFLTVRAISKNGKPGPLGRGIPYDFDRGSPVFFFDGSTSSSLAYKSQGWESTFGPNNNQTGIIHRPSFEAVETIELPPIQLSSSEQLEVEIEIEHQYLRNHDAGYLESKYSDFDAWTPESVFLESKPWHSRRSIIRIPFYMQSADVQLRFKSMIQSRESSSFTKITGIWVYKK